MTERIVLAVTLTPDAAQLLRDEFPAEHELRIRPPNGVTDDDIEWATVLCTYQVPPERIASQPNLRWLHVPGAGIDAFASLRATRPDLRLSRHGAFNAPAVAEHGLALLLALRRGFRPMFEAQSARRWERESVGAALLPLVRGSEVHVLGYGPISRALVGLLAAVGSHVTVYRREAGGSDPHVARFTALRNLSREVATADALIALLPALPETRHAIDGKILRSMKSSAVLLNLGRGSVLDQDALVAALEGGHLAGAALDVFESEPLPPESPLWTTPRLIVSPHVGGHAPGNYRRGAEIFLEELGRYLRGEPPAPGRDAGASQR